MRRRETSGEASRDDDQGDGTLAPIVAEPAHARAADRVTLPLTQLARRVPVAVVSGRARRDLIERLPCEIAYLVGNHGNEGLPEQTDAVGLEETCRREVLEETGIDASAYPLTDWRLENRYEIYPHWRHRYPEGVTHNTEHVFGLLVPAPLPVTLAPREHLRGEWLDWAQAAERCFSWTNVEAIRQLPERLLAGRS